MFEDVEPAAVLDRRERVPEAPAADEGEKEGEEAAATAAAGPPVTEWLIKFPDEEEVRGRGLPAGWLGGLGGGVRRSEGTRAAAGLALAGRLALLSPSPPPCLHPLTSPALPPTPDHCAKCFPPLQCPRSLCGWMPSM